MDGGGVKPPEGYKAPKGMYGDLGPTVCVNCGKPWSEHDDIPPWGVAIQERGGYVMHWCAHHCVSEVRMGLREKTDERHDLHYWEMMFG